jgi:hypothetical protein
LNDFKQGGKPGNILLSAFAKYRRDVPRAQAGAVL